ncbi:CU044_5270 family protein [Streptomyces sp. NPDC059378]|uniref:CU044_5270 family protein n=1 Tax=Streptomyces sp. NPDC059378 TaxID=3346815 RepID=UPI0036792917
MNDAEVLDFPGAHALIAAGDVAPPDATVVDNALSAVRLAAVADGADTGRNAGAARRLIGTRRRVLVVAAVAAVVAGAIAVPTIPFGETPPAASADAATFLHEVAETAADAQPSDAPYWKVSEKNIFTPRGYSNSFTVWIDRTGEIKHVPGSSAYTRIPAGKNPGSQSSWLVVDQRLTWDDLSKLPTDPGALKAYLLGGKHATSDEHLVFKSIFYLLAAPVSPEVRSALYDVLAGLPYLRLVGPVHDGSGRAGTAIEYDGPDRRGRIVIDPKTAMPLEYRATKLGGPRNGEFIMSTTFLTLRSVQNAPKATQTWPPIPGNYPY